MKILGAGLAGLLAGVLNQDAQILEPFSNKQSHQALLRFRSPDIGEAVGIPFKEVQVYKGIWDDGPAPLTPQYISQYARKVSKKVAYRSICNIDPEIRWIAPPDFQDRLKQICGVQRIDYDVEFHWSMFQNEKIISTLPIYVLAKLLEIEMPKQIQVESTTKSIYVNRYKIPSCEVYMTNYFPSFKTPVYRASISNDTLIVESTTPATDKNIEEAAVSLGVHTLALEEEVINYEQENGKISPIDEGWRKEFILQATLQHNVYSLGRFATWRNLVLDDVYHDILHIKKFVHRDKYDHHKDFHESRTY